MMKRGFLALLALFFATAAQAAGHGSDPCPYKSAWVDGCDNASHLNGYITGNVLTVLSVSSGKVGVGQRLDTTPGVTAYSTILTPIRVTQPLTASQGQNTFAVPNGSQIQPGMYIVGLAFPDGTTVLSMSGNSGVASATAQTPGSVANYVDALSSFMPLNSAGQYNLSESSTLGSSSAPVDITATTQPPKLQGAPTVIGEQGIFTDDALYRTPTTFQNQKYFADDCSFSLPNGGFRTTANLATVGASFTSSISGTTLNVTTVAYGTIVIGDTVVGSGVAASSVITALGTGTGGVGTYTIAVSQTVGSRGMSTSSPTVVLSNLSGYPLVADPNTGGISYMGSGAQHRLIAQVSGSVGGAGTYTSGDPVTASNGTTVVIGNPDINIHNPSPLLCAKQSGQTHNYRLSINMAAVEYATGIDWKQLFADGIYALRDPKDIKSYANASNGLGACTFYPSGITPGTGVPDDAHSQTGVQRVDCIGNSSANLDIEGFDWSKNGGTSVQVRIWNRFTFRNNAVWFGISTCQNTTCGEFMIINNSIAGTCYFLNNSMNGNPSSWHGGQQWINITYAAACAGGYVYEYNNVAWTPSRISTGPNTGVYRFFNSFEALLNPYTPIHGEMDTIKGDPSKVGTPMPPYVHGYNTITVGAGENIPAYGGFDALFTPYIPAGSAGFTGWVDDGSVNGADSGNAGNVLHVTGCASTCIVLETSLTTTSGALHGTGTRVDPNSNTSTSMCGAQLCTGSAGNGTYLLTMPRLGTAHVSSQTMSGANTGSIPDNFFLIGNTIVTNRRGGKSFASGPGAPTYAGASTNHIFEAQVTYLPHATIVNNAFGLMDISDNSVMGASNRGYIEPSGTLVFGNKNMYDSSDCNAFMTEAINTPPVVAASTPSSCYGTFPSYSPP